jgi:hypothetical protein
MDAEEIKYAMDNRHGVYPDQLTREALREAGCSELVCILPNDFNERVSYLGNTLTQMLTRSPKDDRLRATVGQLCQALSYMLNSRSWLDGELHDFDYMELQTKLRRFVR